MYMRNIYESVGPIYDLRRLDYAVRALGERAQPTRGGSSHRALTRDMSSGATGATGAGATGNATGATGAGATGNATGATGATGASYRHLKLVPRASGALVQRPVPALAKTATSSINCDECATPLDLDFDVWPDGPDWAGGPRRVDVQGLGRPRCPNADCPSNGGKPPLSGVCLHEDGPDDDEDE